MEVPLLDLRPQFAAIEDEVRAAIDGVLTGQRFILGPEVAAFERGVAELCGTTHAIGVSSGSDALLCTAMALGIGPGDEVIVPAFSFFATAGCVVRLGATPVFVDIEPDTFNFDPKLLAAAMSPRTKAIIVVHLYGQCADMNPIRVAAREHNIPIIEDAAQAIGATHHGQRSGSLAEVGCFSFFPSKNLGAYGDAGIIVTSDDTLARRLRRLRVHGSDQKYYHVEIGGNFRLDTMQAAILGVKLKHLEAWNAARQDVAGRWADLLADTPLQPPVTRSYNEHVFHQYVVRAPRRDELRAALHDQGVATGLYYPVPLHRLECLAHLGGQDGDCPVAEAACREVLALPMYPELTVEAQRYVAEVIQRFYSRESVA